VQLQIYPKSLLPISTAFIKGWARGKFTSCEDDFAHLVWLSRGKFSYKEVQFKKFCVLVRTSCPPAENVNETLASNTHSVAKCALVQVVKLASSLLLAIISHINGYQQNQNLQNFFTAETGIYRN